MKRREFVLLRYSVFFTLLYILVGCTENRVQMQRLQVIDSLMEAHPQAAYDSLCRFDSLEMGNASRKVVMKQRLLMAKAQNKLYLSMPTDSIFQEVVDYYDSKGSDNEKMQAYYLMGCVYRDQKEAPKAMMSYKKAVEYADTLRKECDYKVLFGIYGQMADIYRYQYLHKQSIECYKKYSYYAAKANNMASYIQGFELIASEYYALGDTLKAVEQIKAIGSIKHMVCAKMQLRCFLRLFMFVCNVLSISKRITIWIFMRKNLDYLIKITIYLQGASIIIRQRECIS